MNAASRVWLLLVTVGVLATVPVLVRGFRRRGTGVVYEHSFVTQNLPRVVLLIGMLALAASFKAMTLDVGSEAPGSVLARFPSLVRLLSVAGLLPRDWVAAVSWLGLVLSASGLVFIVGGWYSLGRHFSPDVEIFDDHTVYDGGLFRVVMHPAYSGFIQFFIGSALVVLSPLILVLALGVGLPLAVHRARREEIILTERFGARYTEFAQRRRGRRIVPTFFPIGF